MLSCSIMKNFLRVLPVCCGLHTVGRVGKPKKALRILEGWQAVRAVGSHAEEGPAVGLEGGTCSGAVANAAVTEGRGQQRRALNTRRDTDLMLKEMGSPQTPVSWELQVNAQLLVDYSGAVTQWEVVVAVGEMGGDRQALQWWGWKRGRRRGREGGRQERQYMVLSGTWSEPKRGGRPM